MFFWRWEYSSANPFTLWAEENACGFCEGGRNHLLLPLAVVHLMSLRFTTSVALPFLYFMDTEPSGGIERIFVRYQPQLNFAINLTCNVEIKPRMHSTSLHTWSNRPGSLDPCFFVQYVTKSWAGAWERGYSAVHSSVHKLIIKDIVLKGIIKHSLWLGKSRVTNLLQILLWHWLNLQTQWEAVWLPKCL